MPYKSWGCSLCRMQTPKKLRSHGKFAERIRWLRLHYHRYHPAEFEKMVRKVVRIRRSKQDA